MLTLLIVFGISGLLANNTFAGRIIAEYTGGSDGGAAIQGIVPEGGVGYGVHSLGNALVTGDLEVTGAIPEYPNLARLLGVTVEGSSQYNDNYAFSNINDGRYGRWDVGEWATLGETGTTMLNGSDPWIQLNLPEPQNVNVIVIYSRPNRFDVIYDYYVLVQNSDGVTTANIHGGKFPDGAAPVKLLLAEDEGTNVRAVQVLITETALSTQNIGLAEIELYFNPSVWE